MRATHAYDKLFSFRFLCACIYTVMFALIYTLDCAYGSRYFPNGPEMRRNDRHGKYFLMSDTFERAGTVGFRCAMDAVQPPPSPPSPPTPPPCGPDGVVCGLIKPAPPVVNLTMLALPQGVWCHWGLTATPEVPTCGRQGDGQSHLGSFGELRTGGQGSHSLRISSYDNNPTAFAWSGGNGTVGQASENHSGVFILPSLVNTMFTLPVRTRSFAPEDAPIDAGGNVGVRSTPCTFSHVHFSWS